MPLKIDHTLEIAAPAGVVWDVITDLERYGDWNPFVVGCRSTLRVGDPIVMRVHVFRAFAQSQTESVFEHEPGRLLSYGLDGAPLGAVRSRRGHIVTRLGDDRTRYESRFEFDGWLSPVVGLLVGRQLRRGFGEMAEALGVRAEQIAAC